jgi:hypothetical protein
VYRFAVAYGSSLEGKSAHVLIAFPVRQPAQGHRPGGPLTDQLRDFVAKVPAITAGFWVVKILATTLGETGSDSLSMSMNLGTRPGTFIFAIVFVAAAALQIRAAGFNQRIYWLTIIATTTLGTEQHPQVGGVRSAAQQAAPPPPRATASRRGAVPPRWTPRPAGEHEAERRPGTPRS